MMPAMVLVTMATLVAVQWVVALAFGLQIENQTKRTVQETNKPAMDMVYQRMASYIPADSCFNIAFSHDLWTFQDSM